MSKRGAGTFCRGLLPHLLLALAAGIALVPPVQAADSAHAVTATPPLMAVPATPVSKNVQQRMRACNATADARKLQASARETFIKSCMAARRNRASSRAGSEPKSNP